LVARNDDPFFDWSLPLDIMRYIFRITILREWPTLKMGNIPVYAIFSKHDKTSFHFSFLPGVP
jgi:hypothetical protein